jgi:hypothetical protein
MFDAFLFLAMMHCFMEMVPPFLNRMHEKLREVIMNSVIQEV